eukprot:INCI16025.1.p1 GENE.INCI16025.1~~INCI16025.1.p1  ORF type:complete len:655 (+),score=83.63 INCI16025.1:203-2167(+)
MSILDQWQHMLSRYIRAEISESDLLSCVATLKSSRSKNYQITGLNVTVISGSFKNLPPNLNLFVQASWSDQTKKTETIKRSSSSPVWGTSHIMPFKRSEGIVSCNILTLEVRHSALFVREGILGQGEVYLPSLVHEGENLKARFGLTRVTISAGRTHPNSKLNGFLDVQIAVDSQLAESSLVLPEKASSADIAFEQLLNGSITEEDFVQIINGHRRYCNSTSSNSQLLAAMLKRKPSSPSPRHGLAPGSPRSSLSRGNSSSSPNSPRIRRRESSRLSSQLSEVGKVAVRQLEEGTITQEECDRIIQNDSQFRQDQDATADRSDRSADHHHHGAGGSGGGKGKSGGRVYKSRFDESGNWQCMNTPSESQQMPWGEYIQQCALLDEVMSDNIHRKMKQDTAAAAISNVKALEAMARSQDWGYELRDLKNSLLDTFQEKLGVWEQNRKDLETPTPSDVEKHQGFESFSARFRETHCIFKKSPVDEDHLSKKTKLIRENFFPREPPVFKGEVFEGEYQDLLELLEWEQTSTGAKTSSASRCTQYLPLIASRDEVMELAAKISQLVHEECYSVSLFNRVKASPITLQAMGDENGAAILKSQTTEILRFIKGPPTLELGKLDESWVCWRFGRACLRLKIFREVVVASLLILGLGVSFSYL